MSKKILVTGASGFLGWHFCHEFQDYYQIIGTHFRNLPTDLPQVDWQRINLLEIPALKKLVKELQPDTVLHLAAISKMGFCEEHPALSHHINVYTSIALAEVTQELGIPMIFTSTDMVFNGASAPYAEDDFSYPISQYGTQKQMAEDSLLADFDHTMVVRLPLLFGAVPSYGSNFMVQTIQQLQAGESVSAFVDEYRTPLSGKVASQVLGKLIDYILATTPQHERLIHLGSQKSISRYDLAHLIARTYGLPTETIVATKQQDIDIAGIRPKDVSLTHTMAQKILGFDPPTLVEQLQAYKSTIL